MSLLEDIIRNPQRAFAEIKALRKEAEENRKKRQRAEFELNTLHDLLGDYVDPNSHSELATRLWKELDAYDKRKTGIHPKSG